MKRAIQQEAKRILRKERERNVDCSMVDIAILMESRAEKNMAVKSVGWVENEGDIESVRSSTRGRFRESPTWSVRAMR